MIIYLIGSRASGKTTVGRLLAARLNFPFLDLDDFICRSAGKSIAEIVKSDGWLEFRQLESQSLRKACSMDVDGNLVVATGGGVALDGSNRAFMRASGQVVWLNADCDTVLKRLGAELLEEQRPSLTGRPVLEETRDMVLARKPIYRECCHFEVDGSDTPDRICEMIASAVLGDNETHKTKTTAVKS